MTRLVKGVAVTVGLWLAAAATAYGASGEDIGRNLGKMLGDMARSIYVGIAALIAIVFLFNRRYADLAIFIVAALVVGGFVLAPQAIAGTVRDIWQTLTS